MHNASPEKTSTSRQIRLCLGGRTPRSLLFILGALCAAAATREEAAFDRVVQSYHRGGRFSGAVLVARNDTVVYERAVGLADETWGVPNTIHTRFQIGSLTKQFTAALILDLEHAGKIDGDAPLSRYLPDYRSDTAARITIRTLLNHSAGVPDFVRRPDIMEVVMHSVTPPQLIARYCSDPLEFDPGTQFKYSNCGYLILGAVYEKVSGQSYSQGLAALVSRAGMHDTGVAGPRDLIPNLASAYVEDGGIQKRAPYIDWSVAFSSGSVFSSVEDLWRWRLALGKGTALWPGAHRDIFSFRPFGYSLGWHVGRTDRSPLE